MFPVPTIHLLFDTQSGKLTVVPSGGQGKAGVDLAPNRLISAGLVTQLSNLGWNVHYSTQQPFTDIPYNPTHVAAEVARSEGLVATPGRKGMAQKLADPDIGKMKKPRLVSAVCEKVAEEVHQIAEKGWLPLTLGGDHSLVSHR
jgi:arginase